MSVGHFHIPGEATRRDYAVYIMVARHRETGERRYYVGKTGDNREGCNPVISRAGNHFSYNVRHSQMRNLLRPSEPEEFDFDYFYTTFGCYIPPSETREHVDVINEMERQLNVLAQAAFGGAVMNPHQGMRPLKKVERKKRGSLATSDRIGQLRTLVERVKRFVEEEG